MSSGSLVRIDEGKGYIGSKVHPVDILASRIGTFSCDPSHYDSSLPKIRDNEDLATIISKYQDEFIDNVIVNLGGKKSSGVLSSSKVSIKVCIGEKANTKPLAHEYNKAKLSRDFVVEDRDWSHLFYLNRQLIEGPTIDVLEPGLHGLPVSIHFWRCEYNPSYSPDKDAYPQVPLKGRIFSVDEKMIEVTVMVHLEKVPPNSTVSIVKRFSSSVPPLTRVTKKRAM
ncbi:hypothetical protein F0562_017621 [Nyssa sinensis]|uniref:Uncharacterized protein n=1 Tax=Nyssa sinensis TaxID=561372 RepID=A0A5J4ZFM8_9ASTE|nr:hypothetical protein F0562_017621 [Nyssa sinensis]